MGVGDRDHSLAPQRSPPYQDPSATVKRRGRDFFKDT